MVCNTCGKKGNQKTSKLINSICNECSSTNGGLNNANNNQSNSVDNHFDNETLNFDDDATMSNVKCSELKRWFESVLHKSIMDIKQEMNSQLEDLKKDIIGIRKELNDTKQTLKTCTKNVTKDQEEIQALEVERAVQKSIVNDNLKYLINLDRNERRRNIILFGVPEDSSQCNGLTLKTDGEKCVAIFKFIGVPEESESPIVEMFRLGKKNENETVEERKRRPIKIRFATNKTATAVRLRKS